MHGWMDGWMEAWMDARINGTSSIIVVQVNNLGVVPDSSLTLYN